ncbi:MAG: glycosyl hydrolase family 8 [Fibrobacterota bacterium]|nr:glycosyl hydrolase family 8 [Chitinispirillaceae bacterium]
MQIKKFVVMLALGAALATSAQEINLGGSVKDGTGAAIENAIVTLASNASLKDTTDAQGKFLISTATAVRSGSNAGISSNAFSNIGIKGTTLRFSIATPAGNGMVTLFSASGKRIASITLGKMDPGVQTCVLPELAPGFYVMDISVDNSTITRKLVKTGSEIVVDEQLSGSAATSRVKQGAAEALPDTLVVTKAGFNTVKQKVDSYDQSTIAITMTAEVVADKDNLFGTILGKTEAEVDAKLEKAFQQLFHGDPNNETIYYTGDPGAYIKDVASGDVRSEGMSYGMMIAAQLGKQTEFDNIWKWAKHYMGHDKAEKFGWQAETSGQLKDQNPAPDGEEYIAAALIVAGKRWNNSSYTTDAKSVCGAAKSYFVTSPSTLIKYVPSMEINDPSYILPAFYEVFADVDNSNSTFWKNAAKDGRAFFQKVCNPTTMLGPYLANFNGSQYTTTVNNTPGNTYRDDCWRICLNIMMDWRFNKADAWQQTTFATKHAAFMKSKHKPQYPEKMTLDGAIYGGAEHPEPCKGLVAPLGMLAFAIPDDENAKFFLQTLWDMEIPSGQYRYYDGLLYMFSLIHCSGRFTLDH